MTSIDNRLGTNFVQMYNPLVDPNSEKGQMMKKIHKETTQNFINEYNKGLDKLASLGFEADERLSLPTAEEKAANAIASKIVTEKLRQQQKETPVYALYKLDGEVVGMYLKDATAYTMFDDSRFQAKAISEAKDKGLTFEDLDAYVSGKMEDMYRAEFGDRFEVETFGYRDNAPLAGDYSEQFFGEDSKFKDLQAMNSKLVMDPSFFAVMTERYQ